MPKTSSGRRMQARRMDQARPRRSKPRRRDSAASAIELPFRNVALRTFLHLFFDTMNRDRYRLDIVEHRNAVDVGNRFAFFTVERKAQCHLGSFADAAFDIHAPAMQPGE